MNVKVCITDESPSNYRHLCATQMPQNLAVGSEILYSDMRRPELKPIRYTVSRVEFELTDGLGGPSFTGVTVYARKEDLYGYQQSTSEGPDRDDAEGPEPAKVDGAG